MNSKSGGELLWTAAILMVAAYMIISPAGTFAALVLSAICAALSMASGPAEACSLPSPSAGRGHVGDSHVSCFSAGSVGLCRAGGQIMRHPFSKLLVVAVFIGAATSARATTPALVPDLDHTDLHRFARSCTPISLRAALDAVPGTARKAEINRMDSNGYTPLAHAADGGCLEIVKLLVEAGADVDASEKQSRWTPLLRAAGGRHADVVRFLLANGADINVKGPLGQIPWSEAVRGSIIRRGPEGDRDKTLQALLEYGADVAVFDDQRRVQLESLEKDRVRMAGEIERLQEEIRRLNATLNDIRSRLGSDVPGPFK